MAQKWTARGLVAVATCLVALLAWTLSRPADRIGDVPYVATPPAVVDRMLELAELRPGDLVVDLGSGDGRIVLRAASHYGALARGIEIDPERVRESRAAAAAAGVGGRAEFVEGDLFEVDLREAAAVTMFLLPTVNLRLRPRLLAELEPGTRVVSHMWDMGAWRPDRDVAVGGARPTHVYQWIVPDGFAGVWEVRGGIVLRLMQRFQELEGELLHGGSRVPVRGTIAGRQARVTTTRPHPRLGTLVFDGSRSSDGWRGGVQARGPGGEASSSGFHATLRDAAVQGAWDFHAEGAATPRWTMRWERADDGWAAIRSLLAGASSSVVSEQTTAPGRLPEASGGGVRERRVAEAYVWGAGVAFVLPAGDGTAGSTLYYGLVDGDRMFGVAHDAGTLISWTADRRRR